MSDGDRYVYVVTHCNGDGDEIGSVGTYSKKEFAKRAEKNYIKEECDDWPLSGEYLRTVEQSIDKWYLNEEQS